MGYKYFTKGQAVKVSAHFYSTEFDCHGSDCCSQTIVNEKLIEYLEQIRTHFNAPITITSPYRCPVHNSRPSVGGAPGSRHTKGDAADIVVKGVAPRKVAQYAESISVLGIGLYESASDGYFVHIDTRDYKSFWYGQNERPMTTFGKYVSNSSITGIVTPSASSGVNTILNRGDNGSGVKALQEKLIKLGYSCGTSGADGDFGAATENAVRRFQQSISNLGVDGIAGYNTLKAIDAALEKLSSGSNKVRVTATELNVRYGPGTQYTVRTRIRKGEIYELVGESNGWIRLKDPSGWVSAEYIEKL